ncbi:hypothetical protein Nhal_3199 [Nitrosococcus halophilus Nc 4]|uniref:Uncharacterized protein n=1 Tax=Nitrosococcus halophilus (strain Nc4) TaxID=472759 RepID=D5C003_NITHN|nr:hypothetical protein Nhal_3199 [Nitrosococcus halophilus Nc 4]
MPAGMGQRRGLETMNHLANLLLGWKICPLTVSFLSRVFTDFHYIAALLTYFSSNSSYKESFRWSLIATIQLLAVGSHKRPSYNQHRSREALSVSAVQPKMAFTLDC